MSDKIEPGTGAAPLEAGTKLGESGRHAEFGTTSRSKPAGEHATVLHRCGARRDLDTVPPTQSVI